MTVQLAERPGTQAEAETPHLCGLPSRLQCRTVAWVMGGRTQGRGGAARCHLSNAGDLPRAGRRGVGSSRLRGLWPHHSARVCQPGEYRYYGRSRPRAWGACRPCSQTPLRRGCCSPPEP